MSESIESRALRWAAGDDTGVSSKAILKVMTGQKISDGWCYPHDSDDLGRCLRLLALIPEWRTRLSEMGAVGPEWRALVKHWDELAALRETGNHPAVYARMKAILSPIEAKRAGLVRLGPSMSMYVPPRRKRR